MAMRVASVAAVHTIFLEAARLERTSAEATHAHGLHGAALRTRLVEIGPHTRTLDNFIGEPRFSRT